MNELKFRPLRADEIECRVAVVRESGLSLLLYKDARVDQTLLDEVVGPMNWQRHHSRDNRNCTVSIWDDVKKQWIEKEDTGTESNTEAEKGLASDSFKRACFNWGIGRELYTAPFIWIGKDSCSIKQGTRGNLVCYDKFQVVAIEYDDKRITAVTIRNNSTRSVVYQFGKAAGKQTAPAAPSPPETAQNAPGRPREENTGENTTETTKGHPVQIPPKKQPGKDSNAAGGPWPEQLAEGKRQLEIKRGIASILEWVNNSPDATKALSWIFSNLRKYNEQNNIPPVSDLGQLGLEDVRFITGLIDRAEKKAAKKGET